MLDTNAAGDTSLWRRRFFKSNPVVRFSVQAAVALAALVAGPALVARQWADERLVMFMPEHLVGSRPWELLRVVIDEIPGYLDAGVFRPTSRLILLLEHWVVLRFSTATGLHPNVAMAAVKVLVIFVLVTMVMLTIDQYRVAAGGKPQAVHWRRLYGLTAVLIALSLVLYDPATHPLTVFPGTYLGTGALVLGIPLWFGRSWLRYRAGEPLQRMWVRVGSAVIAGALLASMIELAYLALPLGFLHLLLLSFAAGDSWVVTWKDMFHSEAFLLWALVVTGFTVMFIPVRTAIARQCAEFACSRAAEISMGGDAVAAFPYRVGASFFPVVQIEQIGLVGKLRESPEFLLLAVAVGWLGFTVLTRTAIEYLEDERGRRPRLPMALIGIYFGAVLFFASVLASLNGEVQDRGSDFYPWWESGLTWVAWGVILAVLLTALFDWLTDRWAMVVAACLALLLAVTAVLNQADMAEANSLEETRAYNELGLLLVNFDEGPSGDSRRCDAVADLGESAPSELDADMVPRIGIYLDTAAENIYGKEFCDSGSS